ncbi:DUF2085 domain-containing protein [Petroclostridium sp. X23]|uniref:DUF2085 domain-containing protein n=1 Tax=Petroclostridium sp. X23 TaxID=3045146 RepID=UPI0024ADDFB8|nr:DUF2085 domain-containing protein [Petroclostridium sp. X23]WHH59111.1 DUF2085 domain-containing protein [Petroclostridium sp. X23]
MLIQKIYFWFGSLICHQELSRTLWVDGYPLPFCARDTGIYTGMFITMFFLLVMKRWRCDKPPKIRLTIILCIFIAVMAVDGATSYLGFRTTNNGIRLISGGLFGLTIPLLLFPIANFKVYGKNTMPSLNSYKELAILVIILAAVCAVIYYNVFVSWWIISTLLITTILLLYYRVCYSVTVQVFQRFGRYRIFVALFLEICLFICLYLFSTYVFAPLRQLYDYI